jgi:hypothetical protein
MEHREVIANFEFRIANFKKQGVRSRLFLVRGKQ